MISVCIPVYNYCVVPLATALRAQADGIDTEVELVCIDDGSSPEWRERNRPLADVARCVQLDQNIGRARIRNLFLQHARGDYLLFLDNDSVVGAGFLSRYAATLQAGPSVVVGGRVVDRRSDSPERHLRYLYGSEVESRSADQRRKEPYRSFMTNNFVVSREVLERIRFDERLSLYGHEDTLFGYRLQQEQVPILHIDNPVVNGDVETNDEFLRKTDEAVQNLVLLQEYMAGDAGFEASVRLLAAWRRVQRRGAEGAVYAAFRLLRRPLLSHFMAGNAISIRQFSFYKLGLFIEKRRQQQKVKPKQ